MEDRLGQAAGAQFEPATVGIMPDEDVLRLTLLRHGSVRELEQRVVRGQLDVELSDEGHEQHARLADWLGHHVAPPDLLLTSDLVRCRDLAHHAGAVWGVAPTAEPALREQDMGRWAGRTWEAITAEDGPRVTAYWDDYVHTSPPGGESLADLALRATAWFDRLKREHPRGRVVAVTHVGFVRVLLCHLLGVSVHEALRFAPATASVTQVLWSEAGAVLETLGERPWLFGADAGPGSGSGRAGDAS